MGLSIRLRATPHLVLGFAHLTGATPAIKMASWASDTYCTQKGRYTDLVGETTFST